jgi:serine/threonine protein kinase
MPELDLRPFGVNYVLTPKSNLSELNASMVLPAWGIAKEGHPDIIAIGDQKYVKYAQLGAGTYGVTYLATSKGVQYAVKCVRFEDRYIKEDLRLFIQEAIIQILLYKAAPYVPMIYQIGYDPHTHVGVMVSELMQNTLRNLIVNSSKRENDILIPEALTQLSYALRVYAEKFQFNHRDLHSSNIMFVNSGSERKFKLIDFGFSCINWHGLRIQGNDYFSKSRRCYKPDRNLAQAMYYIVTSTSMDAHISPKLKTYLQKFLHAKVGDKDCDMVEGCLKYKMKSWSDTYDFLNKRSVKVPAAVPEVVIQEMARFREGKPFVGRLLRENEPVNLPPLPHSVPRNRTRKAPKVCPEGKILNPMSGRCVKITGAVGKRVTAMLATEA